MTEREKFLVLLANQSLHKVDAIVLLAGDGFHRVSEVVRLYNLGLAPIVVVSGGVTNYTYGSFPAFQFKQKLMAEGLLEKAIVLEEKSQNTKEQAINIIALAEEKNWKSCILVASHYHQFRAFLTFVKELQRAKSFLILVNAPARDLPWFTDEPWGRRIDLLPQELEKIDQYGARGDCATYEEGIAYLKNYESRK